MSDKNLVIPTGALNDNFDNKIDFESSETSYEDEKEDASGRKVEKSLRSKAIKKVKLPLSKIVDVH
jgi:hypothetical protein